LYNPCHEKNFKGICMEYWIEFLKMMRMIFELSLLFIISI